jgi:hypothetical protein
MSKTFKIDALIDPKAEPKAGTVKQRGAGESAPKPEAPITQESTPPAGPPKRLSLVLDGETYQELRRVAFETGKTHQAILDEATRAYLRKHARTQKG